MLHEEYLVPNYNIGPKHNRWKGGRSIASNGYVLIRVGIGHPLADVRGYAYEHRIVAEKKLGRPLIIGELIHHIDRNKQNNSPDNLEIMPSIKHHNYEHSSKRTRAPNEANPLISCVCGCGQKFQKYDYQDRPRKYVSGHNIKQKGR